MRWVSCWICDFLGFPDCLHDDGDQDVRPDPSPILQQGVSGVPAGQAVLPGGAS